MNALVSWPPEEVIHGLASAIHGSAGVASAACAMVST